MTLIKSSMLNAIAVAVRMVALLGLNKVLAIYVGPAGYAALGQFQNAIQMITTFASGAINVGVTKYTAEYYDDEAKQRAVWRTAGSVALIGSLVTAIVLIIFRTQLSEWLLNDSGYQSIFIWFAFTLAFFVLNALLLAILNGKKEIKKYVLANIAGSISALIFAGLMAASMGLYGALLGLAVYPSLTFFATLAICYKSDWFKPSYLVGGFDRDVLINLSKYTAMALTSAACVPISHILIRQHLGNTLGWEAAGQWEAMWRLSAAYLMLATTTLSVYYLPRLSELKAPAEIKKEIFYGYKIVLPITAVLGVSVFLVRDLIIETLFSVEFIPMRELFAWQIMGDGLKMGSWIVSYLTLSKAMTRVFICSEVVFSVAFVVLVYLFTNRFGLKGASVAHAVNYLFYWVIIWRVVFRSFENSSVRR